MSRALSLNERGKEGKEGRRWPGATAAVASCRPCPVEAAAVTRGVISVIVETEAREEETNERAGAREGRKVSRGGFVPLPLRPIAACAARSVAVSCHGAAVKARRRGSAVAVSPSPLKTSVVTAASEEKTRRIPSISDVLVTAAERPPLLPPFPTQIPSALPLEGCRNQLELPF
ncbi:uncharacterized protein [Arachis hypogaea]|uniref:uncharacterized protein n=1 Tax=Arachis hypogaea TaxID=3818 RepID=UPI000DEC5B39|nr:uncharacterized protein LOC112797423 [Arachis hypogaea]XP_025696122.1 uncharacterized protein LOC112797423 [Arachis hypogaea]XP_029153800.1 uncharacterized protein LOC112797423 [Arachis hypogaea]QHO39560.1 uncharacterized protein DS421_4g130200 [Arachis hypogaea]